MPKPTKIQFKVQEASDDQETTTFSCYIGSVISTLPSIILAAKSVGEGAALIMTGQIIEARMSIPIDISAWTLVPSDGTDTDRLVSARLIMASLDPFYAQLNFPTFDLAKLGTGKDVDQSDADVITLLGNLQGTTLTTSQDQEVDTASAFYRTFGGKR